MSKDTADKFESAAAVSRRTTRAERQDYLFVHDLLKYNQGRGYYSYAGFPTGPGYTKGNMHDFDFSIRLQQDGHS